MTPKIIPDKPLIFTPHTASKGLPLAGSTISAGFPSPADDYLQNSLDLNTFLVNNPSATFYVRVSGESMTGAGIHEGDILVVDRSLEPARNRIIVGVINGEFTVKRLVKKGKALFLVPENPSFKPLEITAEMDFRVWGVVSYVIHKV